MQRTVRGWCVSLDLRRCLFPTPDCGTTVRRASSFNTLRTYDRDVHRHASRPMPELPEVETTRRGLAPHLEGRRIASVTLRRPDLRWPIPREISDLLPTSTIATVRRRAKYLLATLTSGETLVMHLGMSGWFNVSGPADRRREIDKHDHVIFDMSSGAVIVFNDPRRFGMMTLLTPRQLAAHPVLGTLGPEPLSDETLAADYDLTPREIQVARLIAEGLSNSEIAERLGVKFFTARNHVERTLAKLGVRSRHRVGPMLRNEGSDAGRASAA